MKSNREVTKALVLREVTKAVALFSRHFWLPWPGEAELGKMSFTTDFVYDNYNFQAQLVFLPLDPFKAPVHTFVVTKFIPKLQVKYEINEVLE